MNLTETVQLMLRLSLKDEASATVDKVKGKFLGFETSAANVGTVLGGALGGAGIAALKLGDEYQSAMEIIRTGTGLTGAALADLEQSFKDVGGQTEHSLDLISTVMTGLNQRTGLTGDALESLTQRVLDFSDVTRSDAVQNTADLTRVFGDWSIATEDQAGAMDKLMRAGQASGLEMDRLMQTVVQFGAPLRLLGFEFEESIAMLAKWEKEGVNVETALTGMKFALRTLTREGVPSSEFASELRKRMEGIKNAADPAGAALDLFGQRAGSDLAAAIVEGRFAVEDILEVIENGGDTVDQAAKDTEKFGDGFGKLKNQIKLAVGPIMKDFAGLTEELGNAIFLLPAFGAALGRGLGSMWTKLGGSAAIKAAAALAGSAAGVAYTGGVKVAEVLTSLLSAAFYSVAGTGSKAMLAARAAGIAAAGAIGAGLAFGLPLVITEAIKDALPKNLLSEGLADSVGVKDFQAALDKIAAAAAAKGIDPKPIQDAFRAAFNQGLIKGSTLEAETQKAIEGIGGQVPAIIGQGIEAAGPGLAERTAAFGERVGMGFGQGYDASIRSKDYSTSIVEQFDASIARGRAALQRIAFEQGAAMVDNVAQGMVSASQELGSALSTLRDILKNGLTPEGVAAQALGAKFIQQFTAGLNSEKIGAKEAAQQVGIEALQALSQVSIGTNEAKRIGRIVDELYASGMTENQQIGALAAQGVGREALYALGAVKGWSRTAIDQALQWAGGMESKEGAAANAGQGLAQAGKEGASGVSLFNTGAAIAASLARGIASKERALRNAMRRLTGIVTRSGLLESPAKEGDWSKKGGPFAWFRRAGEGSGAALASGLLSQVGAVKGAMGMLAGASSLELQGMARDSALLGRVNAPGLSAPRQFADRGGRVSAGGVNVNVPITVKISVRELAQKQNRYQVTAIPRVR